MKKLDAVSVPVICDKGTKIKSYEEMVDYIEKVCVDNLELMDLPLTHRLTPGLYSREMFAPSGVIITSLKHKTEHQFFLLKGKILIMEEGHSYVIEAPYTGISKTGVRRIGVVIEDVIWTTVHSTSLVEDKEYTEEEFISLINSIESEVVEPWSNNLIDKV